jgi:hypothetical protein
MSAVDIYPNRSDAKPFPTMCIAIYAWHATARVL